MQGEAAVHSLSHGALLLSLEWLTMSSWHMRWSITMVKFSRRRAPGWLKKAWQVSQEEMCLGMGIKLKAQSN